MTATSLLSCLTYIRIEPDWNVKNINTHRHFNYVKIRIEPDWNVKLPVNEVTAAAFILE